MTCHTLRITDCIASFFSPTQTTLADFQKPEFSVVRQHEEFIWLHDSLEECENYAGLIVSFSLLMHHTLFNFKMNQSEGYNPSQPIRRCEQIAQLCAPLRRGT